MGLSSKQVLADSQDWPQIGGSGSLEIPKPTGQARNQQQQQQQRHPPVSCPRCDSTNTKFCYYNNYSRSQPRHFCRACRRHWTEGGTLRNVPVGGGRKNKRPKTSTAAAATATNTPDYGGSMSSTTMIQHAAPPFSHGDLESSIFPDVFRQLLLYPPPLSSDRGGGNGGSFMDSLFSPPPPLQLPEFTGTTSAALTSSYDEGIVINPLMTIPTSSSPSSPYNNHTTPDSISGDSDVLLTLMPSSTTSTWLQDPPPLLATNYNWTWWDDTTGFAAPELGHPASAGDDLRHP